MERAIGKKELIELLEPTINALGYDLVDLDARIGGNGLLRLFIDKDPAVTLADCEYVSEQVGAFLDVEDPLPGRYVLEVSSPGVDRRLRTESHFERVVGSEVKLELTHAVDGRRRFRGHLLSVADGTIELVVDNVTWKLPLADLATARLVPAD